MSGSYPNPFFTTPGFAQGLGALAQAFMPNPDAEAARGARIAQAGLQNAQTGQIQQRMRGATAAGDRLRGGDVTPQNLGQVVADMVASGDPQMIAQAGAALRAFGGAAGADPERMAQLFVGAGGAYENTQPGFMRTDETRRRGQDVSAGATLGAARIGADGMLARTRVEEEGRDRRLAVTARPGEYVTVPGNSPVAPAGTTGPHVIRGDPRPTTLDQARAGLVQPLVEGTLPPDQAGRAREIVAGNVAAAEARAGGVAARPVPAGAVRQIETVFANQVTLRDGTTVALDVASQRWLRERAAALWQSGAEGVRGNVEAAINEAFAEYEAAGPARTDSSWNPFSAARTGLPPTLRRDAPAPADAAAPPAAAPGYRNPRTGQTIPEGTVIRQNGRNYIIRGGQPVPAS